MDIIYTYASSNWRGTRVIATQTIAAKGQFNDKEEETEEQCQICLRICEKKEKW